MSELIDNRTERVRTLKGIIRRLHAGEAPDRVRASMRELVSKTDYSEIVAMEQELMADGMPVEEIQGMCDLHSQTTREVLVQLAPAPLPPGHPADTFRRENEALRASAARMRKAMNRILGSAGDADLTAPLLEWRQALNELQDIDKHYQRKEHLVFTCLERHGITGPSKVMWGKDDQVRSLLKDLGEALRERGTTSAEWSLLAMTTGAAAAAAVEEMIYKEEQILFPMCLERFTAEQWAEIWSSSPRYGWCLVEPRQGYRPAEIPSQRQPAGGGVSLPTGTLSLQQLTAIFSTLPVDLTFVDAEDRVAFFSEGPHRVFARSRAIIGRKVQNCHPPRSVDVVDRILADFREGRRSVAEFWIQFTGRFVHIRYFAVRSEDGQYLGTLEVTQDVGSIRALEGQRGLCDPCREELPKIAELAKRYRERGLVLLTVSADEPEQERDAAAFLERAGAPSPAYIKRAKSDEDFINAIDRQWSGALPALFLYGRDGRKAASLIGESEIEAIESALRKLL